MKYLLILMLFLICVSYFSGRVDGKFDGFKEICQDKEVVMDKLSGLVQCMEEFNTSDVKSTVEGFNFRVIQE